MKMSIETYLEQFPQAGGLVLRSHSRRGEGKLISFSEVSENLSLFDSTNCSESQLGTDEDPPAPQYTLFRTSQRSDKRQLKDDGLTHLERKESAMKDKVSIINQKMEERVNKKLLEQAAAGIYPCMAVNDQHQRCTRIFLTLKGLNNHLDDPEPKHEFSSTSLKTTMFLGAIDEKEGALAAANFTNRSPAILKDLQLVLVPMALIPNLLAFKDGCYNKPERKKSTRMTEALKKDLTEMFDEGERTKAKYSPEQAYEKLRNIKLDGGRSKYSHAPENINGPLPDESRIKSFFHQLKVKRAKPPKEDLGYASKSNIVLKAILTSRNLSNNTDTASFLKQLFHLHDLVTPGAEELNYSSPSWNKDALEAELINRYGQELSKPKSRLIAMLKLSDEYAMMLNSNDEE